MYLKTKSILDYQKISLGKIANIKIYLLILYNFLYFQANQTFFYYILTHIQPQTSQGFA